jgi:hypothetical protein
MDIGFIGLGIMGAPRAGHLRRRCGASRNTREHRDEIQERRPRARRGEQQHRIDRRLNHYGVDVRCDRQAEACREGPRLRLAAGDDKDHLSAADKSRSLLACGSHAAPRPTRNRLPPPRCQPRSPGQDSRPSRLRTLFRRTQIPGRQQLA